MQGEQAIVLRIAQSIAIIAFFAVMMTFLFRDHILPDLSRGRGIAVDHRILTDNWASQDDWLEIRLGEMKLGAMRTVADEEPDLDGYSVRGHLEIRAGFINARLVTAALLNNRLEVHSVRAVAVIAEAGQPLPPGADLDGEDLPPGAYELVALMRSNTAYIRIRRDDAVAFLTQPLPRPVTMTDSIAPILRGDMLTENVVYTADIYDPLMGGGAGRAEIEWVETVMRPNEEGDMERIRRVEMRMGQTRSTMEVSDNGQVLRREIPLMMPAGAGVGSDAGPRLVLEARKPR